MINFIIGAIFILIIALVSWSALIVNNKSKNPDEKAYEDEEQAKWIKEYSERNKDSE